jgi:hypothetical protein
MGPLLDAGHKQADIPSVNSTIFQQELIIYIIDRPSIGPLYSVSYAKKHVNNVINLFTSF